MGGKGGGEAKVMKPLETGRTIYLRTTTSKYVSQQFVVSWWWPRLNRSFCHLRHSLKTGAGFGWWPPICGNGYQPNGPDYWQWGILSTLSRDSMASPVYAELSCNGHVNGEP